MSEDSKAGPTSRSAPEFLAALERSGVLPDATWRQVKERFVHRTDLDDPSALAQQLIEDGTLTEFQARRLLRGKKSLSFGRYALLDQIAKGERGRVFKARHRLMDRVVVLKVLHHDGSLSEKSVSRFFREIKMVGLIDHPHVVRSIDADVHEGFPFIVMEYLEGDDLEQVLARHAPLQPDAVIEYMAQASRGLAHAHEMGVIHRDVKPTNLFLVDTGIVKVLDLGFGELIGLAGQPGNIFDTDAGIVVGTTDFMSPEQVMNEEIDARTDLFSLGCTMYRLLTGAYAFPGVTQEDRLIKRIQDPHVPIEQVRPGLSNRLIAIVDRLLAIRRDDRFGSAAEAAEALEALISQPGRTGRVTSAKPGTKRPGAGPPVPTEPEAPLDWSRIESAFRSTGRAAREAPRLVDRNEPKSHSNKGLSSHRNMLQDEDTGSGREVQKQYRQELIQMNRAMAELRSADSKDEAPTAATTWLERIGEQLGDYLAEPTAAKIVIAILAVLLVLAVAFALVVG